MKFKNLKRLNKDEIIQLHRMARMCIWACQWQNADIQEQYQEILEQVTDELHSRGVWEKGYFIKENCNAKDN